MPTEKPSSLPSDPRQWRPLEARRSGRAPEITDPIVEPFWQGVRVLAHFKSTPDGPHRGTVELIDETGTDVADEFGQAAEALADAVYSDDAVIDGILTDQATASGFGVGVVPAAHVSQMGMLFSRPADVTVDPVRGRERSPDVAFVALDLLWLDGEALVDLPLLERKRQLESLIVSNEFARVSPFARPPLAQWLNSWRSAGFAGVVLKAANSRYRQADVSKQWAIVERPSQR